MIIPARWYLAAALALLPAYQLSAQSVRDLSLRDVLQVALERTPSSVGTEASVPYQASSWLAGLPSVSVGYLGSDEREGTDEIELRLNLPMKSSARRKLDRDLESMREELDAVDLSQRGLYLSGLIREAAWSHRIEQTRARFAADKRDLLRKLESRQRELHAASAISGYALLLVQKELLTAEIELEQHQQASRQWLGQYRRITGLGSVPEDIVEPALAAADFRLDQHPQMRAVELAWLQRQRLLLATSDQSQPWNLSLTAKNLESPEFDENQYGIAVDVPLAFMRIASQPQNSEWREAARRYDLAKDQLALQLLNRWDALHGQTKSLQRRQQLLAQASQLSREIAAQVEDLQASNELEEEIVLRKMMESIDSRADAAINQMSIHQNAAMQRQAAGVTL